MPNQCCVCGSLNTYVEKVRRIYIHPNGMKQIWTEYDVTCRDCGDSIDNTSEYKPVRIL